MTPEGLSEGARDSVPGASLPDTARVVVGPRAALATHRIRLTDVNWLGAPGPVADMAVAVRVRSTREPRAGIRHNDSGWLNPTL